MDSRRDWSELFPDVLVEIAVRVPLIEDFMAFRGVCSSWRSAVSKDKFKPQTRLPLLMLPGKIPVKLPRKRNGNDEIEFYSLSQRKTIMRLPLPETKLKRCLGVGFGWILTVASSGDAKLLNPFTRAQIELPNLASPPCSGPHFLDEFGFIERAVLSEDPSRSSNFVLLALFSPLGLGFWRLGNKCWKGIEPFVPPRAFGDIAYYRQKFYAVDEVASTIWVWNPFECHDPAKVEMIFDVHNPRHMTFDVYLVESSSGELLLISSHLKDETVPDLKGVSVRITTLDIENGEGKQIVDIGNEAVFVGANASFSVAASAFPDFLEPNCIYFSKFGLQSLEWGFGCTDGKGKNMGIYNLKGGSTEWLVANEPPNRICPPVWIAPSF